MLRHRGQPGHHARTCPLIRQGTAAAAHPYACFSKRCSSIASRASLQRLWGSKAHKYRHIQHAHTRTHTHTHTYTYIHIHAHTYTHTNTNARKYSQARTRTYTCTRTNAQIHALSLIQTHKHTGTHTRTQTHTHTHTRTHAHTHAYARTRCASDGLRQIFSAASDAPTIVFHIFLLPRAGAQRRCLTPKCSVCTSSILSYAGAQCR